MSLAACLLIRFSPSHLLPAARTRIAATEVCLLHILQVTDLHLSDRTDTPAAAALRWAIDMANERQPDLVAFTGNMTTYGTSASAEQVLAAAQRLSVPWVFTPGNAERRSPGAFAILAECMTRRDLNVRGVRCLLPDTSTGRLPEAERQWLAGLPRSRPSVLLTHYPLDTLDDDSHAWMRAWMRDRGVELYLAGHRHFSHRHVVDGYHEVITRGLDPDKAFGGAPGLSLFERGESGTWTEEEIPWPHGRQLLPAEIDTSPVGWSIHGDPTEAVRDTFAAGLHVLELRPRRPDYDLAATRDELGRLRDGRALYLSWHLPSLTWSAADGAVTGQDAVARQIEHGRACGVDAFTVHVPQVPAGSMVVDESEAVGSAAPWGPFLETFAALFREAVAGGARLSIENIHNAPGTPLARAARKFGTEIGELLAWHDAVREALPESTGRIGVHLDVGHARNNGELGNAQPLGDWYARVGAHITGYHIHQVRPHEDTGKLTNHRDIRAVYDRTVSYAGFMHAWSTGMIRRAPLFIEIRDAGERRRTVRLFQKLFAGSA